MLIRNDDPPSAIEHALCAGTAITQSTILLSGFLHHCLFDPSSDESRNNILAVACAQAYIAASPAYFCLRPAIVGGAPSTLYLRLYRSYVSQ